MTFDVAETAKLPRRLNTDGKVVNPGFAVHGGLGPGDWFFFHEKEHATSFALVARQSHRVSSIDFRLAAFESRFDAKRGEDQRTLWLGEHLEVPR